MREIEILNGMPVVLTKDKDWVSHTPAQPGAVIFLPDDAVLVALPQNISINKDTLDA